MTTPILPRLADTLIDEALRCVCDASDGPMCARCECLVELAHAIDIYSFEQVAGVPWHVAASRIRQVDQLPRLGALRSVWYTTLGWLVQGYAALYALCWSLPWVWWSRLTGRNTLMQPDAHPERDTAEQEARLHAEVHGVLPPRTWGDMLITGLVIVLGMALAWGLALWHLGEP